MKENKGKQSEFTLENAAKAVPLAIGFFICCGSLHLSTYYRCFHINIFNYLDSSEILVTFLYLIQDIAYFFALFIACLLIVKLYEFGHSKWRKYKGYEGEVQTVTAFFQRYEKISYGMIFVSFIFTVVYVIKAYYIEIDSNYIIKNRDWMGVTLMGFSYFSFLWITAQFELGVKGGIRNAVIFFALFFISYSICEAINRIEITVNRVDLSSMVIHENDTIRTSPKYIYVGRTNKYVFFFDTERKIADVIPQDGIKKISFRYQKP